MSWKGRKLLSLVSVGVFLASCSSIDCSVNSLVRTQYQFTSSDGNALTLLDSLSVVTTTKDGKDTTILNKGVNISTFQLPISYSHPEDILVFQFSGSNGLSTADTVWVKKNDYPHFESVDCNAIFFHQLTDVRYTRNCLDSIVIKNPSVTNDDQVVHLYIYPKTDD